MNGHLPWKAASKLGLAAGMDGLDSAAWPTADTDRLHKYGCNTLTATTISRKRILRSRSGLCLCFGLAGRKLYSLVLLDILLAYLPACLCLPTCLSIYRCLTAEFDIQTHNRKELRLSCSVNLCLFRPRLVLPLQFVFLFGARKSFEQPRRQTCFLSLVWDQTEEKRCLDPE